MQFSRPIKKRAELVKSNAKFAEDVCNILRENAEERAETSSQIDLEPEEQIYKGLHLIKINFFFQNGMQLLGMKDLKC